MNKEWDWLDRQLPHGKRFLLLHFQKRWYRSRNKFSESREVNLLSPHKSIPVRIYPEKQTPQNKKASKPDKPTLSRCCQIFETVLHTSFNSSFRGAARAGGGGGVSEGILYTNCLLSLDHSEVLALERLLSTN